MRMTLKINLPFVDYVKSCQPYLGLDTVILDTNLHLSLIGLTDIFVPAFRQVGCLDTRSWRLVK